VITVEKWISVEVHREEGRSPSLNDVKERGWKEGSTKKRELDKPSWIERKKDDDDCQGFGPQKDCKKKEEGRKSKRSEYKLKEIEIKGTTESKNEIKLARKNTRTPIQR